MRNKATIVNYENCITGIPVDSTRTLSSVQDLCVLACHMVTANYMSTAPSFTVNGDYMKSDPHESDIEYIYKNIEDCRDAQWRIISGADSWYVNMATGPDGHIATVISFVSKLDICTVTTFLIGDNCVGSYNDVPFVISMSNHKRSRGIVNTSMANTQTCTMLAIYQLKKSIQRFVENKNHISDMITHHTKLEMRVFKKLLSTTLREMCILNLTAAYGASVFNTDAFLGESNYIEYYVNLDRDIFPTINMSKHEWERVESYVAGSHLIVDRKINMLDVIKHQRFGKQLAMVTDSGEHLNCDVFIKDDELMITMIYEIDRHHTLFISCLYDNVTEMNIVNDIQSIRLDVWTKDAKEIQSSATDYQSMIPESIRDVESIGVLANRLLQVYIVIHDRPNRGRFDPDTSNDKADELTNDVIIRRILGPMEFEPKRKQAARDKSATSSTATKSANTRDANYVVEYWERCGHWRKTPNGTNTWIAPTMCQRHLPLSDKEVILKL